MIACGLVFMSCTNPLGSNASVQNNFLALVPKGLAAKPLTATTTNDTGVAIVLQGSNGSGALTYTIVTNPSHGTVTGTAPTLTYTPTHNWAGTDTLTYTVSDGTSTSSPATVSLNVNSTLSSAPSLLTVTPPTTVTGLTGFGCGQGPLTGSIPATFTNNSAYKMIVNSIFVTTSSSAPGGSILSLTSGEGLVELNPGQQYTGSAATLNATISGGGSSSTLTATGHLRMAVNVLSDPANSRGIASASNLTAIQWSQKFLALATSTLTISDSSLQETPQIFYKAVESATTTTVTGTEYLDDCGC